MENMMKKSVTITLDENLMRVLDKIPKKDIPSRSTLIEKLIWEYLESKNLAKSGSKGDE